VLLAESMGHTSDWVAAFLSKERLLERPYKSTVRRGRIFLGFLINSGAPGAAASYSINNASAGTHIAV